MNENKLSDWLEDNLLDYPDTNKEIRVFNLTTGNEVYAGAVSGIPRETISMEFANMEFTDEDIVRNIRSGGKDEEY